MNALWKSESPSSVQSRPVPTTTEAELRRQNGLLRDHVARLVSTNVNLLRLIEDLTIQEPGKVCRCMTSGDRAGLPASRRKARVA